MSEIYKIMVSIGLTNNMSPILAIIAKDMLGLKNGPIKDVEKGILGWGKVMAAVAGAAGIDLMVSGFERIVKAGGNVNHQIELMKIAGMSTGEISSSMAQAMKTSGDVLTTSLSENLAHIRELRYAFGDTAVAMEHLGEISKANTILNAIKGGGHDQVWELVKSLEGKGETFDPAQFSSYINTMTKVIEATGGKVTPQQFMSTFKYGRTATLGWSEDFVGGALPRLMQSMATGSGGSGGAGGPGNALMSAFAKVVQGQMPKKAAQEWAAMGLTPGGISPIAGSSQAQIVGGIGGADLFMKNPYEWVQKTLMPALASHGITDQNGIIAEISKMFPVRTASQIITEMGLQGRFREGENSPFEKDIRLQHGAMGLPGYNELIKNDYPTLIEAFNKQFTRLLETLGSPLVQPGGPVLSALAGMTSVMSSMAQIAGSEQFKSFMGVIGKITGGIVSIDSFVAKLFGQISGITAVFQTFGNLPWDKVAAGMNAISAFVGKLEGMFSTGNGAPNQVYPGGTMRPQQNMFHPGEKPIQATPISLSLNIDGRTLAQVVSDKIDALYRYETNAPAFNGAGRFA